MCKAYSLEITLDGGKAALSVSSWHCIYKPNLATMLPLLKMWTKMKKEKINTDFPQKPGFSTSQLKINDDFTQHSEVYLCIRQTNEQQLQKRAIQTNKLQVSQTLTIDRTILHNTGKAICLITK